MNREYVAIALSDRMKTTASIAISSLHEEQQTHNAIDKAISQRTRLTILTVMNNLMFWFMSVQIILLAGEELHAKNSGAKFKNS